MNTEDDRPVRIDLLEVLRDRLRSGDMPPWHRFEMNQWLRHRGLCGTAGCALGTAALLPEFKEAGFKASRLWGTFYFRGTECHAIEGFVAVTGITNTEANTLAWGTFSSRPLHLITAAEVAVALDALIERLRAEGGAARP